METAGGEDDRVKGGTAVSVAQLPQPRVHIPSQGLDLQVRSSGPQKCGPPNTACPNDRTLPQLIKREAGSCDQHIT